METLHLAAPVDVPEAHPSSRPGARVADTPTAAEAAAFGQGAENPGEEGRA